MMATQTEKIRALNDNFRRNIFTNNTLGEVCLTAGVAALIPWQQLQLLEEIATYEDFNEGNDPYQEHDFGSVEYKDTKYFFKIDYYDNDLKYHSPDPANPNLTNRVMTIMRADEY